MKNIDVKSLIIGALLTSTIFLGVAATGTTDKWDVNQKWETNYDTQLKGGFGRQGVLNDGGWEPFSYGGAPSGVLYRRHTK